MWFNRYNSLSLKVVFQVNMQCVLNIYSVTGMRSVERGICPIAAVYARYCSIVLQTLSLKYPGRDLDLGVT